MMTLFPPIWRRILPGVLILGLLCSNRTLRPSLANEISTEPTDSSAGERSVDLGLFATVRTSDPLRKKGTAADRLSEFPAADVFLDRELVPNNDVDVYDVPISAKGVGCIGLQWAEKRLLRQLILQPTDKSQLSELESAQIEYWSSEGREENGVDVIGQTPWQGEWTNLPGTSEIQEGRIVFTVDTASVPEFCDASGTLKIRWLLPKATSNLLVRRPQALGLSTWTNGQFHIEAAPGTPGPVRIVAYNGLIVDPQTEETRTEYPWVADSPLNLQIRYSVPQKSKADRTILRFEFAKHACSVAIEDVLDGDGVYVKDLGLFISRRETSLTLEEYEEKIAGEETILQRVCDMPDQTFEQAMQALWRPSQNADPTMLSLACENKKVVLDRDGVIRYWDPLAPPSDRPEGHMTFLKHPLIVISPQVVCASSDSLPPAAEKTPAVSRSLEDRWLPIIDNTAQIGALAYRQRTCVVPCGKASNGMASVGRTHQLCVAEFSVTNSSDQKIEVVGGFQVSTPDGKPPIQARDNAGRFALFRGDILLACLDTSGAELTISYDNNRLIVAGPIQPGATARYTICLPLWSAKADVLSQIPKQFDLCTVVKNYWTGVLDSGMQVELPEPFLENMIRATEVECMMVARNDADGRCIAPWIAAVGYGPFESEAQPIILGMDLFGHQEFARRSHDFFLASYNPQGFLTPSYTLIGTGQHLWTLAEHYRLTADRQWLAAVAPKIVKACRWIADQTAKTQQAATAKEPLPESGLVPPGVLADWNRYAYYFYANGQYYAGLTAVAAALRDIQHPAADELERASAEYQESIRRAYRWQQARMPVIPLRNGVWVPPTPSSLYCFGLTSEFYGGRSPVGHDVELGGNHLFVLGLLDPRSREAQWTADYHEDQSFLFDGVFDEYPAAENEADWFNRGGFAKIQPHYARTCDFYAIRDNVKAFVRTYFNTFPVLLNKENMTYREHFNGGGAWEKTHESGWFLEMTRTMMLMERNEELWLAPMVTNRWLEDGNTVAVHHAPTRFGVVSYRIVSHVRDGVIDATIDSPKRNPPKHIVLRIRHPQSEPMKSVAVNGKPHLDFDPVKETIRLTPSVEQIHVHVEYARIIH